MALRVTVSPKKKKKKKSTLTSVPSVPFKAACKKALEQGARSSGSSFERIPDGQNSAVVNSLLCWGEQEKQRFGRQATRYPSSATAFPHALRQDPTPSCLKK